MHRAAYRIISLVLLIGFVPIAEAQDCRDRASGDICAAGSPWSNFTRFRVAVRGEERPDTTTMVMHGDDDFSIETESAPAVRGQMIVVGGRALLMKDVPHEPGYEIDALDGTVLTHQLVIALLDQAFPEGPTAVRAETPIKITQKERAIRIATASASGRLEAPWTLNGTARPAGSRIEYDLRLEFTAQGAAQPLAVSGYWEKEEPARLDDRMSIDGWSLHWLGPMTLSSERGTILDYGAKPAVPQWANLGALRAYIADEPARRARRRSPVDAANPGVVTAFSYSAVVVDKRGNRTPLGERRREYRPGADVLVEKVRDGEWEKTLPLDYGLSVSTTVSPDESLRGFGLVLEKDDSGFSWEWFSHEQGDVFRKLLGGGRVKVTTAGTMSQELVALEFLDEMTLRCEDTDDGASYEVLVKKGSVLRLKP